MSVANEHSQLGRPMTLYSEEAGKGLAQHLESVAHALDEINEFVRIHQHRVHVAQASPTELLRSV